ncbi:MAG: DNA adenine methylase, partial [Defluviitaleaceae bacterium]|nr:DNA adenine methylase [Defluviitaleaceae bacterium]
VIIENNSFERVIKQYDRTGSLLYLDPPYHTTEYFYNGGKSKNGKAGNRGDGKGAGCSCGNGNDKGSCGNNSQLVFGADDHVKLRDMLVNIKGKFILSYNDDEFLRELYKDFNIHGITRSNPMTAQTGTTKDFKELIITNF